MPTTAIRIFSDLVRRLTESTADPLVIAAKRIREAKPGDVVELPEGLRFTPLGLENEQDQSVGEQRKPDSIESKAEGLRAARPALSCSRHSTEFVVDDARNKRVVDELTDAEQHKTDGADQRRVVSDCNGGNRKDGTGSDDSLVPFVEDVEIRQPAHSFPRHARVEDTPRGPGKTSLHLTFSDTGAFIAESRAVALLEDHGFSVGHMQAHAPRGILFGLYDIQKWRNLNSAERAALHGVMTGSMRNGPITVEILDSAPDEALASALDMSVKSIADFAALPPRQRQLFLADALPLPDWKFQLLDGWLKAISRRSTEGQVSEDAALQRGVPLPVLQAWQRHHA